jgi:hypothetical protein
MGCFYSSKNKCTMTIKCKAVLLSKLMIRMVIIMVVIILALFLSLPGKLDYMYMYTIGVFLLAPAVIYVFYINRFELLVIGVEGENVHFSFVNNSIYKRKDIKTTIDNISVEQKDDQLLFHIKNERPAILRKTAVAVADWDRTVNSFVKL